MNSVLNNMLAKYDIKNTTDEINAMKEIIQEIVISLMKQHFMVEQR